MAKLKVFTLGVGGFINATIRDALGLPRHVQQARILVSAPTKAAAAQLLDERGFRVSINDRDFRQAMGNDLDALAAAGVFDEATVVVFRGMAVDGDPAAVVETDGSPRLIGRFRKGAPLPMGAVEFIPKGN